MPTNLLVYRCLVISPGDVNDGRQEVIEACQRWNAQVGAALEARVDAVAWEYDAVPELGGHPQKLFNPKVDSCDFAIAVFWTRLGSPTTTHESGSVEEIERMLSAGKPVMVYFSEAPIAPGLVDPAQLQRLADFKKKIFSQGIVDRYSSPPELGRNVVLHVTAVLTKLLIRDRQGGQVMSGALTAPVPDVRVSIDGGQVFPVGATLGPATDVVIVNVMNRSPVELYLSQVILETDDHKTLIMPLDLYGQSANTVVKPGNSFQFLWDREALRKSLKRRGLLHAIAIDKVGRQYRSPEGDAHKAVAGDLPEITLPEQ